MTTEEEVLESSIPNTEGDSLAISDNDTDSVSPSNDNLNVFQACFQCKNLQTDESSGSTLYLLQCMHSACRTCLLESKNPNFSCKCGIILSKQNVILCSRIACKRGECQRSPTCRKRIEFFCKTCDLALCHDCHQRHLAHEIEPYIEMESCNKHQKMPAKFLCGCGQNICHVCSTGYDLAHHMHTKKSSLPAAKVIDSCEKFKSGIAAIENSTKITYDIYQQEQEKCKQHFHQMRIELANQTSEIVNAVLRRMNDCVLSIETYETRFEQTFYELSTKYSGRKECLKNLKKICGSVADNNPIPGLMPFISEASSLMSTDMTEFTTKIVDSIRELSQPPSLSFDTVPILSALNSSVRLNVRGQLIHPLYRTDPSLNIVEVPILKLAENPIIELSDNLSRGEKRPAGPLADAVAAKKYRMECGISSAAEIAGTKITHPTMANATPWQSVYSQIPRSSSSAAAQVPPSSKQNLGRNQLPPPPKSRQPPPPPPPKSRQPPPPPPPPMPPSSSSSTLAYMLARAPKVPSVAQHLRTTTGGGSAAATSVISFRPRENFQQQRPQIINGGVSGLRYIQPAPPGYLPRIPSIVYSNKNNPIISNISNSSSNNNKLQKFPIHLQIRPKPHTRVIRPSSVATFPQQQPRPNGISSDQQRLPPPPSNGISSSTLQQQQQNGNNLQNLPRVPVMPSVKKGSEDMQQALLDFVKPASDSNDTTKKDSIVSASDQPTTSEQPAATSMISSKSSSSDTVLPSVSLFSKRNKKASESSSTTAVTRVSESSESSSQNLRRSARLSKHK